MTTGTTKERSWPAVGNCSSALQWLSRYYCFRGNQFLRFNPVTGEVLPKYPLDVRDYFIPCPGRGEKALAPDIHLSSLSFQTPHTPAPILTLWYSTLALALAPSPFWIFPVVLLWEKPTPPLILAISYTSDCILTSDLPLGSPSPIFPLQAIDIGMGQAMGMVPILAIGMCAVAQV